MKLMLIICLLLSSSCSYQNEIEAEKLNVSFDKINFPQKWQLTSMSGSTPNSQTSEADMSYQEYYLLNGDATFIKVREQDSTTIKATGSYKFVNSKDGNFIEITHDKKNELIGNCSNTNTEILNIISNTQLQGTWWACDGPGLFYELVIGI